LVKDDSFGMDKKETISTKNNPEVSLYSNSENALAWIDQYYGESELSGQLQVLKNKGLENL
jgi:hypothetical protein